MSPFKKIITLLFVIIVTISHVMYDALYTYIDGNTLEISQIESDLSSNQNFEGFINNNHVSKRENTQDVDKHLSSLKETNRLKLNVDQKPGHGNQFYENKISMTNNGQLLGMDKNSNYNRENYSGIQNGVLYNKILAKNSTGIKSVEEHQNIWDSFTLNVDPCRNRSILLVLCVTVQRNNSKGRQTIRQTWGSFGNPRTGQIALVFFLGSAKTGEDPNIQTEIYDESAKFQDIVQGDFVDDYFNLTLKSLNMLSWLTQFCSHSQYILKADDDVYINVPLLKDSLIKYSTSRFNKPFIVGCAVQNSRPRRKKLGNNFDKWYLPKSEYQEDTFPRYVNGACGYAMTTGAAISLHSVSHSVPVFKFEDIYITGMLAQTARIPVIGDTRFSGERPYKDGQFIYKVISAGNLTSDDIDVVHGFFQRHSYVI